ncbi:phospho-N-acetylmuramoyl-pentapeptide-transferase [Rhodococcus sp. BP-349]|uniref:phospho-N-acetylmuramoyl-pentapeptide- transferase n=1 Tax=unclassified Rhodococcus (in: high G+C Gram-positive bacteria) TaxID=192944 RepID=UPI000488111F|nr:MULTISPECIES: phospho-N-acetylmuramoyl-pentapeptide-transferase [unclassified Rhodococcus (in: high G+C Gram-positive bacteria)]KQU30566.1 phospho-N-acetylmuramoyl-pentapeptide-transferase [Rhodococcus sp. Leaf225]KQU44532.1 phospho-N-acetylmuramoyl-pentapeptide-transferase [Rhodococcus sp. Leaf258]MBY6540743.1 phospho-N-acetylmuramoyl-pentapeptide-transferase [Rhodococcus sp. BP-363]MBY6545231.1 phospho-N-acetylmuramoyl-pentapeptide-transferase [Rhodococcus sp. BP-369]MBY6564461.1 phospho-
MRQILFAGGIALAVAILLTPVLIKAFSKQGFGQEIRVEGPASHQSKRGTPTMGGVAILAGLWAGYWGSHLIGIGYDADGPSVSALLVLGLTTVLGVVGFLDDFIKIRKQRNLGLNKTAKLVGQLFAAVIFGVLALQFNGAGGLTPGSVQLSYVRDIATVSMGGIVFILFCYLLVSAWSNAVNLTDGLDGLAAGSMTLVLGAYTVITFWQYRQACTTSPGPGCYDVRDPLDLALICAAAAGACIGFLWWNAAPAKIFMGDTGSLALGGLLAGLSIVTRTELLMVVIGALFVAEAASVVIQVAVFRSSRRRVFRMAPFHHHFELGGWAETTVIIRFWLLAAISSAVGLALFYSEYLSAIGD